MDDEYSTMYNPLANYGPIKPIENDPIHSFLVKRKAKETNVDLTVIPHDTSDVKEIEELCKKYNIIGFNFGNMNPRVALQHLKRSLGIQDCQTSNTPSSKQLLHD